MLWVNRHTEDSTKPHLRVISEQSLLYIRKSQREQHRRPCWFVDLSWKSIIDLTVIILDVFIQHPFVNWHCSKQTFQVAKDWWFSTEMEIEFLPEVNFTGRRPFVLLMAWIQLPAAIIQILELQTFSLFRYWLEKGVLLELAPAASCRRFGFMLMSGVQAFRDLHSLWELSVNLSTYGRA